MWCCDAWTARASRAMRGSASAYSLGLCVCCDVNGNVATTLPYRRGTPNDVLPKIENIFKCVSGSMLLALVIG